LNLCLTYNLKLPAMKTLHCRDAGFDCPGVIRASTEEEVLKQAAQHAQEVHGVSVTPELAEQLRTLIKDENEKES
jgi:predicted small metal-binding protein